jgi:EmrB/QacA subfamily drug resistance transporter
MSSTSSPGSFDLTDSDAPPNPRALFFAVFPSIMLPMFLASVDGTIVAAALPAMAGALGEVQRVSWVVVAYLVAATISAPVYGRLGDALGRRRMMFIALSVLLVAHVLCMLATSMTFLIAARVLQGIGGGGLMTLSQALVGESVPPRERGRYQGYMASVFVCSSTIGPVAGGWLTQHLGWRSVFSVGIPIAVVALGLTFRLKKSPIGPGRLHFDFIGMVLFALFIAPALMALEQIQHVNLAALPLAALLAAIAAASLMLLLRQERRARAPLLPVAFLSQSAVWRTDAMAVCMGATLVSTITFIPIYFIVARGTTPSEAGVLMLPLTALIAVGSMITGRLISLTGRSAIIPSFGLPVATCLIATLAFAGPHMSLHQLPWLLALISMFCGTAMPVVQVTVQMLAGPRQLGAAAASVQFSRSIGAAVGTAIVGVVLFATLALTDPETAHLFARLMQEGPAAMDGLAPARVLVVRGEIAEAFRAAFLAIACFAGMGAMLAWSLPVRRIS